MRVFYKALYHPEGGFINRITFIHASRRNQQLSVLITQRPRQQLAAKSSPVGLPCLLKVFFQPLGHARIVNVPGFFQSFILFPIVLVSVKEFCPSALVLVYIFESAFTFCSSLTKLVLPASIKFLGSGLIGEEIEIHVPSLEAWFRMTKDNNGSSPFDNYPSESQAKLFIKGKLVEDIVIPSSIQEIKKSAFSGYKHMKSVTIPDSVTDICYNAFACCGLKKAVLPKALKQIVEERNVFMECEALTEIIYI